ncbi:hypothetical protein TNCV_1345011 [Trichonephila clavipes]|nr:hypothetical protein TNCV_1345011 [Trichonephila clavipes]
MSLIDTNPFENIPEEFWPIVYKKIFNHSSQSTAINCYLPLQENCMETEVSNANVLLSFLQGQSNFQEVHPDSVFEYNEVRRVNMDMQGSKQDDSGDISVVRQCIGIANDCLFRMNFQHNYLLSKSFDSRSKGLILSELPLFNPKPEVLVLQSDDLEVSVGRNSEKKKISKH